MMFLDLLLGILVGLFIAAATALMITITCLLLTDLRNKCQEKKHTKLLKREVK